MEAETQSVVYAMVDRRQLGSILKVVEGVDVVSLFKVQQATVDEYFETELFPQQQDNAIVCQSLHTQTHTYRHTHISYVCCNKGSSLNDQIVYDNTPLY